MKQKVITKIGEEKEFSSEYTDDHIPIDEVIKWLQVAKKEGATHIEWGGQCYDGDSYPSKVSAQPTYEREETDEEYNNRIAQETQHTQQQEARKLTEQRKQYELLKEKFEPKSW